MLFALIPALLLIVPLQQPSACADATTCRAAALEAAAQRDFEAFHDLAWRAAQKGRPNDPDSMYLLARAQSLSGRPGDALVMLRRLAQLGIATDARDNDDFQRVRALPGWTELESVIAAAPGNDSAAPGPGAVMAAPAASGVASRPATAPAAAHAPATVPTAGAEFALRLTVATLDPIGLAYDSASRRFVLGDRHDNKLMVADEVFNQVNDLISAASAGFGRLSAVEIDSRRGDLWVTSSDRAGGAAIHKLQLVSGRVLSDLQVPAELQPVAFSDFAVTDAGTLLLLDSRGGRLLRAKLAGRQFERPFDLRLTSPSSIAPAGAIAFVSHEAGLSVVDVATGHVSELRTAARVSLARLRRIRWSRGTLLGLQGDDESARLVRIRIDRGHTLVTAVEPMDGEIESAGTALTISRDAAYYIARADGGVTIRRVPLK